MPDTSTFRDQFPTGSEVSVTVTGRVAHSDQHGNLVVEYVGGNGFPDRFRVRADGPAVTVDAAEGPPLTEKARRERAARMVATSFLDTEMPTPAGREWVERWNDAYPPGTRVSFRLNRDGEPVEGVTSAPA